jgi:hypothetical protein
MQVGGVKVRVESTVVVEMPWVNFCIGGMVDMPRYECWQGCFSLGWIAGLWSVFECIYL